MTLWDILNGALYVADTPGALTRGVLAGDPGGRATGREMLEAWGALGENTEGLDWGDAAGLGADILVDPLNLLFGAGGLKAARAIRASKAAKAERAAVGKRLTDMVEGGRLRHGGEYAGDADLDELIPLGYFGDVAKTPEFRAAKTGQPMEVGVHRAGRVPGPAERGTFYGEDAKIVKDLYSRPARPVESYVVRAENPFVVEGHIPNDDLLWAMAEAGHPRAAELAHANRLGALGLGDRAFLEGDKAIQQQLRSMGHDAAVYLGDPYQSGAEIVMFGNPPAERLPSLAKLLATAGAYNMVPSYGG